MMHGNSNIKFKEPYFLFMKTWDLVVHHFETTGLKNCKAVTFTTQKLPY